MDVRMPGIEATRRLRATAIPEHPPYVIILTAFDLDEYVYAGLHAGAAGFLLKDTLAAELITAIRTAVAGQNVAAPAVTTRLRIRRPYRPGIGLRLPKRHRLRSVSRGM